ncbi:hypothetical protein BJ322DRAFT_1000463 [Thelephora terrestris]|uniref:C2H2-type domain-containing protein n=1 Tax=Thelephora terrestris TaxID=56493 RepID=A0A9P6L9H5_9AGAM|nr:hypothetical protein BJ322DRAFT_1000463 [Thelephora terrestris]
MICYLLPDVPAPASAYIAHAKISVCPLFSRGSMCKRVGDLKRHRSHTMGRPFRCHQCGKKFYPQDNVVVTGGDERVHADAGRFNESEGVDAGLLNIGVCEAEVEGGEESYPVESNRMHPTVGQSVYNAGLPMTNNSPRATPLSLSPQRAFRRCQLDVASCSLPCVQRSIKVPPNGCPHVSVGKPQSDWRTHALHFSAFPQSGV